MGKLDHPMKILALEDNRFDLELILFELRQSGYVFDWVQVENECDYREQIEKCPDIILADYTLPQFDAMRALLILQERDLDIPFIVVTGSISEEVAVECMKQGASDYLIKDRLGRLGQAVQRSLEQKCLRDEKRRSEHALRASEDKFSKAFHLLPDAMAIHDAGTGVFLEVNQGFSNILGYRMDEVIGSRAVDLGIWVNLEDQKSITSCLRERGEVLDVETIFRRKNGSTLYGSLSARRIEFDGTPAILSIMRDITGRKQAEEELKHAHDELEEAYDATIEGWALAMELRDSEIEGHSRRVTALTVKLAEMFGLPDGEITNIRRGVLLHDIGKMAITDRILQKDGPLTEEEWAVMRKHPTHAYRMLSSIAYLRPSLDIPYCHHEHWDGSGYPRGLKGEEIPLAARLFAVVDVWDALRSDRPYRAAVSREEALDYIRSQSGLYFDPQVADLFLRLVEDGDQY